LKPILFNTEMVRAILDGRKTATRRIIKPQPKFNIGSWSVVGRNPYQILTNGCGDSLKLSYQTGDILYVRETFTVGKIDCGELPDGRDDPYISQCPGGNDIIPKEYAIRHDIGMDEVVWKPSIFMPKEAARIFLRVTDVRAERLQEISKDGCFSEGIDSDIWYKAFSYSADKRISDKKIKSEFMRVWNGTIKKSDIDRYGWNANPFVWVYEFERTEKHD